MNEEDPSTATLAQVGDVPRSRRRLSANTSISCWESWGKG